MIIDVVLGLVLLLLVWRGWRRGLVQSLISLAVLIVGSIAAFRLSTPVGDVVSRYTGTSPDVSRLIGGAVVWIGLSIGAKVAMHMLRIGMRFVPGLRTLDRAAGAALAGAGGLLVATVVVSLAVLVELPHAGSDQVEESQAVSLLTDIDGVPQRIMNSVSGDRVLSVVLQIDRLIGSTATGDPGSADVVLDVTAGFEAVADLELADLVLDGYNSSRVSNDAAPLPANEALAEIARSHAIYLYDEGLLSHRDANGDDASQRVSSAGLPYTPVAELIGLGSSVDAVLDAWEADNTSRGSLQRGDLRRVGIGAVDGPLGLLVVVLASA